MQTKLPLTLFAIAAALAAPPILAVGQADRHFMKEAIEGNLSEVKVGGLAQQKGTSEGVKDFGAMLAKDHATANDKAKQAAQSLGVQAPTEPGPKQKSMYESLAKLSGRKFDQQFIEAMVKDHQEDIAKYEKEANSGSSAAASYAKEILPSLRKHLQTAQQLQQQESSGTSTSSR